MTNYTANGKKIAVKIKGTLITADSTDNILSTEPYFFAFQQSVTSTKTQVSSREREKKKII